MEPYWIAIIVLSVFVAVLVGTNVYLMFFKEDKTLPDVSQATAVTLNKEHAHIRSKAHKSPLYAELAAKETLTTSDFERIAKPGYETSEGVTLTDGQLVLISDDSSSKLHHVNRSSTFSSADELSLRLAIDAWIPGTYPVDFSGDVRKQLFTRRNIISTNVTHELGPNTNIIVLSGAAYTKALSVSYTPVTKSSLAENDAVPFISARVFGKHKISTNDGENLIIASWSFENSRLDVRTIFRTKLSNPRLYDISSVSYTIVGIVEETITDLDSPVQREITFTTAELDQMTLMSDSLRLYLSDGYTITFILDSRVMTMRDILIDTDSIPGVSEGVMLNYRLPTTVYPGVDSIQLTSNEDLEVDKTITVISETFSDGRLYTATFTPTSFDFTLKAAWVLPEI